MSRAALLAAALGVVLAVLGATAYVSADFVEHGHLLPWAAFELPRSLSLPAAFVVLTLDFAGRQMAAA